MGHNESAVISAFKQDLRELALEANRHFDEYALGGQDREVLADDIWRNYDHFAIVDSKWSEEQIPTEKTKEDRVRALCDALAKDARMASLHARCHRIAWRDSATGQLTSQEYRRAVCGRLHPATCKGLDCKGDVLTIEAFAAGFFGNPPTNCVPYQDFRDYIAWLTRVITGSAREIIVLARGKSGAGARITSELTLTELCQTLPARPKPSKKNKMR